MKRLMGTLIVVAGFAAVALAQQPEQTPETMLPETVVFEQAGILPEGVEWDAAAGRFLVGSLAEGTIFEVRDDGTINPLIEDDELVSTVGIHLDGERLLVTDSDSSVFFAPGAQGQAGLAAYDLMTGERLFLADLGALTPEGAQFANDVVVDDEGNAYVTNSFQPVIWVDTEGNAEVFTEDERLLNENFGANGIEYVSDDEGGYLLVGVTGAGVILKIPVSSPEDISQVALSEPVGIDGMVLDDAGRLIAVGQTFGRGEPGQEIVVMTSDDDWETGTVTARLSTEGNATTVAIRDGSAYYVNAYLNNPAQERYEIVRAEFEGM